MLSRGPIGKDYRPRFALHSPAIPAPAIQLPRSCPFPGLSRPFPALSRDPAPCSCPIPARGALLLATRHEKAAPVRERREGEGWRARRLGLRDGFKSEGELKRGESVPSGDAGTVTAPATSGNDTLNPDALGVEDVGPVFACGSIRGIPEGRAFDGRDRETSDTVRAEFIGGD